MRRLFASVLALAFPAAGAGLAGCSDNENPTFPTVLPEEDGGREGDGGGGVVDPDASVQGDPTKGVLLVGTVIGENGPYDGAVLVTPDGKIACAEEGTACSDDPAAEGVARVLTSGVIAPGLIDTHNHIMFDIFDGTDWLPEKAYANHDQWPLEQRYKEMVDVKQCLEDASQGKPTWCPAKYDGPGNLRCEMLKFGELKGLVSGTTSIVGLAGTAFPCYGSLARSIDTQFNGGLGADKVQTAAIFPSKATADGVCRNYESGKTVAYLIHVGEGTDQRSRDEWTKLGNLTTTPGCLYAPQTVITHGTAFTATEFGVMKEKGMKLVWSPASNMALYNATTDVPLALDHGLTVALAPDWSMGGSPNMLDELRAARKVSLEKWGGRLTARDVVTMGTKNAAEVLGLGDQLGVIKKGHVADLFVVRGTGTDPYETILASTPGDVRLTMVAGQVIYGDETLRAIAAFGDACEPLDACGTAKFVCAAVPGTQTDKLGQTAAQVRQILEAAMTDVDATRATAVNDGLTFSPLTPTVSCPGK